MNLDLEVEPEKFKPRLFHIIKEDGSSRTLCNEIDLLRGNINSDDKKCKKYDILESKKV